MGETPGQITQEIEQTRARLGSNLHELETRVKQATDWREQFRKNPMAMLGIAFGGGIMLSAVVGGKKKRPRK
jgi:ElaB/YqjD/DUF883 family membrane-anchored ribosome-binding protein